MTSRPTPKSARLGRGTWARIVLSLVALLPTSATSAPQPGDSATESVLFPDVSPVEYCRIRPESPADWAATVIDLGPASPPRTAHPLTPISSASRSLDLRTSAHWPSLRRRARAPGAPRPSSA